MSIMIYFRTQIFEYLEQMRIKKHFYKNLDFKEIDQSFLKKYKRKDPYQISKNHLKGQKASNIYTYGETPLTTIYEIATKCQLSSDDYLIEMGAGRGRAALFLANFLGCKVTGYEVISEFAQIANSFENERFEMRASDMFQADFEGATVIYLYGTMLEEEEILLLSKRFPKSAKIITVSYPLKDYSSEYETIKTFQGRFPWGKTDVYWNERKK